MLASTLPRRVVRVVAASVVDAAYATAKKRSAAVKSSASMSLHLHRSRASEPYGIDLRFTSAAAAPLQGSRSRLRHGDHPPPILCYLVSVDPSLASTSAVLRRFLPGGVAPPQQALLLTGVNDRVAATEDAVRAALESGCDVALRCSIVEVAEAVDLGTARAAVEAEEDRPRAGRGRQRKAALAKMADRRAGHLRVGEERAGEELDHAAATRRGRRKQAAPVSTSAAPAVDAMSDVAVDAAVNEALRVMTSSAEMADHPAGEVVVWPTPKWGRPRRAELRHGIDLAGVSPNRRGPTPAAPLRGTRRLRRGAGARAVPPQIQQKQASSSARSTLDDSGASIGAGTHQSSYSAAVETSSSEVNSSQDAALAPRRRGRPRGRSTELITTVAAEIVAEKSTDEAPDVWFRPHSRLTLPVPKKRRHGAEELLMLGATEAGTEQPTNSAAAVVTVVETKRRGRPPLLRSGAGRSLVSVGSGGEKETAVLVDAEKLQKEELNL